MKKPFYLCVVSGKGGVGKSTVAAMAAAFAERSLNVGLIDADIYGFSIPAIMGVREEPQSNDGRLQPIVKQGVKLMFSDFCDLTTSQS